jgi:hypothetical protein
MPGETGQAFIDRMLRDLSTKKGSASALPVAPKVEITPTTAKVAKAKRVRPAADPAPAEVAEPKSDSGTYLNNRETWRLAAEKRGKPGKVAQEAPLDWLGRPDRRPTTKAWPPGPMGPDGRSTHRYVGPWPPKWASKWTTGPK